ncbi:uncharacterized protein LOC128154686 isoform X2 [Harpia harpyja]|uniref:uncharacterized protein LOC128154686 isoform X2 n=1 Tax=Harpia harpyja TaxID=202280 RepID=UPI0022B15922|nr:uncharacterized protein LOC128154686 isoform X2 [Harpia harpyja]
MGSEAKQWGIEQLRLEGDEHQEGRARSRASSCALGPATMPGRPPAYPGTEADELNPTPVTCSPPSSKACLLPLLQHGALCGSGRGEERAGECTGAGSMGEHAGELGRVSTGAFGSWEPSTSCTAHSVPPLQPPA